MLDASALVELLLETPSGHRVAALIADPAIGLHVPHVANIEVTQALRRYARDGDIGTIDAETAISARHSLDLQRHAHELFLIASGSCVTTWVPTTRRTWPSPKRSQHG